MQRARSREGQGNILLEMTKYFPETDMFLISEMSYQANNVDTTHTVPNGFTIVHIKKLNHDVKYALAMYKSRLGEPRMRV